MSTSSTTRIISCAAFDYLQLAMQTTCSKTCILLDTTGMIGIYHPFTLILHKYNLQYLQLLQSALQLLQSCSHDWDMFGMYWDEKSFSHLPSSHCVQTVDLFLFRWCCELLLILRCQDTNNHKFPNVFKLNISKYNRITYQTISNLNIIIQI